MTSRMMPIVQRMEMSRKNPSKSRISPRMITTGLLGVVRAISAL
jgi:hypothetical protein